MQNRKNEIALFSLIYSIMHIKKEGYYYTGNVIGQEVVICAYGDADRTWSGEQVYREYDDETYGRGSGKYEQKAIIR